MCMPQLSVTNRTPKVQETATSLRGPIGFTSANDVIRPHIQPDSIFRQFQGTQLQKVTSHINPIIQSLYHFSRLLLPRFLLFRQ